MQQPMSSAQGIPAILQALETGGMPNGNLGKLPSPAMPNLNAMAQAPNGAAMPQGIPGVQGASVDPLQAGMQEANPQLLQLLLDALLRGGAFNAQPPVV